MKDSLLTLLLILCALLGAGTVPAQSTGSVLVWGYNREGQTTVPATA